MPAVARQVPPAIDPEAIRRFVDVVFGGLSGFADLRLLAEKGTPDRKPRCNSHPLDEHLAAALTRAAADADGDGRACFVVPAATAARGRASATTVSETAVVVVDLDEGDLEAKQAHLVEHLGPATLVVASGGMTGDGAPKRHLYWRLDVPARAADLERVRKVREAAARKVGADASLARLQQPIRLPGSVHAKHGRRAPVQITEDAGQVYALDTIERGAEAMPSIADDESEEEPESLTGAGRTRPVRANGVDGITRFDAISRFIGEQVRLTRVGRATRAETWQAVRAFNATTIEPSWSETRLRREYEALELVDRRNHGGARGASIDELDRTEHGLARRLADDYADEWRYVSGRGWLAWTGSHWRRDETNGVLELCRRLCEAAAEGVPASDRRRLLSDRSIRGVERLARSDPRVAAGAADWDADAMLLNTPSGVVDLRTGEVTTNDPALHMTLITRASVGTGCPRWVEFIRQVTGGDRDLAAYLQRIAGYCLTGRTDEQAFFFLHGSGANGKTVLLDVVAEVLGTYARTAPLDTFMAARSDRPPIDLAALDGARMVIATETEASRPWAEARIKAVTGGDRIAVRHLYQGFYETRPGYKLLIAGNHRPRLTGGGKAMARRLQLIPFDIVVPEGERDGRLREKLVAERDGILGWMLAGCRAWQEAGLRPPQRVRDAVAAYIDSEDFVGQWIAECCVVGATLRATSAELYRSWRQRAETIGIEPGNARDLGERLRDVGFTPFRDRRARGWTGLQLLGARAGGGRR